MEREKAREFGVIARSEYSAFMPHACMELGIRDQADERSTSIRLASLDEVLKAKAYLCFVSSSLQLCSA